MAVSPPYHPTPKATATQMPVDYEADDLEEDEAADEDRLGDAVALEGVARYPVRVKCALLGWMAAKDAILTYQRDTGEVV